MVMTRLLAAFLLSAVFPVVLPAPAAAATAAASCDQQLVSKWPDSSIEVELRLTDKETGAFSENADGIFRMLQIDGSPLTEGSLEHRQQMLKNLSALRTSKSLWVPQLFVQNSVPVRWGRDVCLMGHCFEAEKTYDFDMTEIMRDLRVQYGSRREIETAALLEFHFRSGAISAGKLQSAVWLLLEGLGIRKKFIHQHVVVPVAPHIRSPEKAVALAEHYRRTNLAAEMISIVEKGVSIKDRKIEWFSLKRQMFRDLIAALLAYQKQGLFPPTVRSHKKAYVAFYFPNKYDGGIPSFGYEYRSISQAFGDLYGAMVNSAQKALISGHLGFPASRQKKYFQTFPNILDLSAAWYQPDTFPEISELPTHLKDLFEDDPTLRERFMNVCADHLEAYMLIHDWSKDPLFFDDPEYLKRVAHLQRTILEMRKVYGLGDVGWFTQKFLRESHIYERVLKSVGIDVTTSKAEAYP